LKWEHTEVISCYFALTSYIVAVLANVLAHIDWILHADRMRLSASDSVERTDEVTIDSGKSIPITLHFTVVTPRYFQLKGGSTTYLEGHKSVLLHPSASIALEQSMEIRSLEVGAYCDLK
jgi:hypothetical protein